MQRPTVSIHRNRRKSSAVGEITGSTVPDAPVIEPETEPVPETSPPPVREPEPTPFDPEWPEDRPEPQPKA